MGYLVEFYAITPGTGALVPLPDVRTWDIGPVRGNVGAVKLTYPANGQNFATLIQHVTDDTDLEVAVWVNGVYRPEYGCLLQESSGDQIDSEAVWAFSGRFLAVLLDEAIVAPVLVDGKLTGQTFSGQPPGAIIDTLITQAQGRGALAGVTTPTWSSTLDSNGVAWTNSITIQISPGNTVLATLMELADLGTCEWLMVGRELRLYNPGTLGVDRTLTTPPVILYPGRDQLDAPMKHTVVGSATALYMAGAEGLYKNLSDSTAQARRGRRIERYDSQGNISDDGTLTAATQSRLAQLTPGTKELSHGIAPDAGGALPLIDFDIWDWVFDGSARDTALVRYQVAQWTLSCNADKEITTAVVLNDLVETQRVILQRRLDNLSGGTTVVGTSSGSPEVDDGVAPAAPTGLNASTSAYVDETGVTFAQITGAWSAVTLDADGTSADDLAGYRVQWRYQGPDITTTDYESAGDVASSSTTLSWSGLAPGQNIQWQVAAYDKFGHLGAFSSPLTTLSGIDVTPPPVPSAPAVTSYLGLLAIEWNGLGSLGETMPTDFNRVQIHVSTSSGFTPSAANYVDDLRAAGVYPHRPDDILGNPPYGTTFYVRLVSYDNVGNPSAASAEGSAVLTEVQGADVASLSVGKLTTGILTALMTVAGIIRTSLTGARVELDTAGLRCISSTGALLFEFNIPSSILTIIGKLIAGAGVGTGSTIVIDPGPPPQILLYPDGTLQRYSISAQSTLRPGGSTAAGLQLNALNTSGQTDGFSIDAWSTNAWIGHKLTSGAFAGGKAIFQRIGGLAGLYSDNGSISLDNTNLSATINGGAIQITSAGDIRLNPDTGQELSSSRPFGTLGAGFSFQAQGGNSGGYRTYTGGGPYLAFVENQSNAIVNLGNASGAYKNFVIDHPTDPERLLVHACIEAPEALVSYRGEVELTDGEALVELPGYFEAATLPEGRTVHLTMLLPDEPLSLEVAPPLPAAPTIPLAPGPVGEPVVVPERMLLHPVAASRPRHGRFRIVSSAPDGTRVAWLVQAVRADGPQLVAEPLRSDVVVHGDGPYRYISPQEST